MQGYVVEIAANRQSTVVVGADIAVHQHFRTAPAPGGPCGIGHFGIGRARQGIGANGAEQPVEAEIGIHHARQFQPQRGRALRIGRRCLVAIGGEGSDSDAQVLPGGIVGYCATQGTAIVAFDLDIIHLVHADAGRIEIAHQVTVLRHGWRGEQDRDGGEEAGGFHYNLRSKTICVFCDG